MSDLDVAASCVDTTQQTVERLEMINSCLLSLGGNYYENINRITALCGTLFPATCALYNRLQDQMLNSLGQWNTPPDYVPTDKPEGHLCYDVILRGVDELFVVRNLPDTPYAQSDPNVTPYNLQTYIGHPVKCQGVHVGSLCVVFQDDHEPSPEEQRFMGILASAIRVEEERLIAQQEQAVLLKKYEHVNKELEGFAHTVSHDLKAPLRNIQTLTTWMVDDYADKLDQAGRESLTLLSQRVTRMEELINGILAYSKAGCQDDVKVHLDMQQLINETIEDIDPARVDAVRIVDPLPSVYVEKTRIKQVIQNLLSNALRFIDPEQGEITITCKEQEGLWTFGFSDNGPGIAQEYVEVIFEMFKTGDPSQSTSGTGVGLAIVKKMVETWGGTVWAESELGQGTCFYFTFPNCGVCLSQ